MNKNKVTELLKNSGINIGEFCEHGKASECYVEVTFNKMMGLLGTPLFLMLIVVQVYSSNPRKSLLHILKV